MGNLRKAKIVDGHLQWFSQEWGIYRQSGLNFRLASIYHLDIYLDLMEL